MKERGNLVHRLRNITVRELIHALEKEIMQMSEPLTYRITFNAVGITGVMALDGSAKFSGPATSKKPKLYVVAHNQQPLYVGVTRQSIRDRLRAGFQAKGNHGYYGYQWRHSLSSADVDIWLQKGGDMDNMADIETVEAEVVFLIRQNSGQWPEFQTEIHFHRSNAMHRVAAQKIIGHYGRAYVQPPD